MPGKEYSQTPEAIAARRRYHSDPERAKRLHEDWRARNKAKQREYHLRHEYGISVEEYDTLVSKQGNRCAVCRCDTPGSRKYWCVDHDHVTGVIRGLLCGTCNSGIGHLEDSVAGVRAALEYLTADCGCEEHY